MKRRVIATIHVNTDRYGSTHRTGTFDFAEFAKLMQDFDSFRTSPAKNLPPGSYVIHSLENPPEAKELRLFFPEVASIKGAES